MIIELRAYAKVNLTLDVLGRRGDGYHEIDSLIQSVELFDVLNLKQAPETSLEVRGFNVPADERNLIWQACVLVQERFGGQGGIAAAVTKNIPAQAGLGGGSSDAAAALIGATRLYGMKPQYEELEKMAAQLGSDVSFFLAGGTARMKGRGEIIEPLPDAPELALVIVWPGFGVSTARAYEQLDSAGVESSEAAHLAEPTSPASEPKAETEKAVRAVLAGDAEGLAASVSNDFEGVVVSNQPRLRKIKAEMQELGARATLLCGSGSAVFGIFGDQEQAFGAAGELKHSYKHVWAARTVARNTVLEGLGWTR